MLLTMSSGEFGWHKLLKGEVCRPSLRMSSWCFLLQSQSDFLVQELPMSSFHAWTVIAINVFEGLLLSDNGGTSVKGVLRLAEEFWGTSV